MDWQSSILELTRVLVRVPSRAGVDSYDPIAQSVMEWLRQHHVAASYLREDDGRVIGITARVAGPPGPTYLLAATLDTAPFGNEANWMSPPLSPDVREGWLYGRGSADSKAGVAIFCHVAASVARQIAAGGGTGSLELLFDADEHNGAFTGARRYLEHQERVRDLAGVFLGYPGNERIQVGSRGFERAVIDVPGRAVHSGSTSDAGVNAVSRAAALERRLSRIELESATTPEFPLSPKLTVTGMHGGEGFSQVPDLCQVFVDVRLTPSFGQREARETVERAVAESTTEGPRPTIEWLPGWPAYRISKDTYMMHALQGEAERVLGRPVPTGIAGPSNIGNYLALKGIPATCGFGVTHRAIHAADECVEIATIEPVFRVYRNALAQLLQVEVASETHQ